MQCHFSLCCGCVCTAVWALRSTPKTETCKVYKVSRSLVQQRWRQSSPQKGVPSSFYDSWCSDKRTRVQSHMLICKVKIKQTEIHICLYTGQVSLKTSLPDFYTNNTWHIILLITANSRIIVPFLSLSADSLSQLVVSCLGNSYWYEKYALWLPNTRFIKKQDKAYKQIKWKIKRAATSIFCANQHRTI